MFKGRNHSIHQLLASFSRSASQILFDCDQREGIKKLSDDKNYPKMNDSEADPRARKNPDEKYYFSVEKS